jgi:hypothetical protein
MVASMQRWMDTDLRLANLNDGCFQEVPALDGNDL